MKSSWLEIKGRLDNFKTTSSDACAALSYIIKQSGHVNKKLCTASFNEEYIQEKKTEKKEKQNSEEQ